MSEQKVADRLHQKLTTALQPTDLEIIDESHKHAKHAGMMNRPGTAGGHGETHFRIRLVSPAFTDKSRLDRHRMVNDAIADEMGPEKVHALAIEARAPGEATP